MKTRKAPQHSATAGRRIHELRNLARGNRGEELVVNFARQALDTDQYGDAARWLVTHRHLKRSVPSRPVADGSHLYRRITLTKLPLERELAWVAAVLTNYIPELSDYMTLRASLEHACAISDWASADDLVRKIETRTGVSLWLIQKRIAILHMSQGIESQKKYRDDFTLANDATGFARFVAHWSSLRNEDAVSYPRFKQSVLNNTNNMPEELQSFFALELTGHYPMTAPRASSSLRLALKCSLVDLYETFISLAAGWACENEHLATFAVRHVVTPLSLLSDSRLVPSIASEHDRRVENPFSLWTATATTQRGTRTTIPERIAHIQRWLESSRDDENYLRKLAGNFRTFAWADSLQAFLDSALVHEPRPWSLHVVRRTKHLVSKSVAVDLLWEDPTRSPFDIEVGVDPSAQLRDAYRALDQERWTEALEIGDRILSQEVQPAILARATRVSIESEIKLHRFGDAIRRCARSIIQERHYARTLPLQHLYDVATSTVDASKLSQSISFPICVDAMCRESSSNIDYKRRFAFEDYLESIGCTKPSQMKTVSLSASNIEISYFLRNVCIEATMDESIAFHSSREVLEERIKVLQWLSELDPDRTSEYAAELRELITRVHIRERMREIEQTKIYVDLEAIRDKSIDAIRDQFSRFSAYSAHLKSARQAISGGRVGEAEVRETRVGPVENDLRVPANEVVRLIYEMVLTIRDHYVSDQIHGLDGYLSVRIRHGTLSAQLRAPLEKASLTTTRVGSSDEYHPNTHWVAMLAPHGADPDHVERTLSTFARAFDDRVSHVTSQWIQIRSYPESIGKFDFVFTPDDFMDILAELTIQANVEKFVDVVISKLDQKLDDSLMTIRTLFRDDLKPALADELTALEKDLDSSLPFPASQLIGRAIREARTELQRSVERASSWFHRGATGRQEPFQIDDAVKLSIEVVRHFHADLRIEYNLHSQPDARIHAKYLAPIVDVLFMLFQNVVRHSGMSPPTANVEVRFAEDATVFQVSNPVAASKLTDDDLARIEDLVAGHIEDQEGRRSLVTEGGTGIKKIRKILRRDLLCFSPLEVEIVECRAFIARFSISNTERLYASDDRRGR